MPLPVAAAASAFPLQLAAENAVLAVMRPGPNGPAVTRNTVGRIWVSTDRGQHWRARGVPCTAADGGAALLAIARRHSHTWLIDCFNNEQSSQEQDTQHHVYRSADIGASWTRLSDPTRHNAPSLLAGDGAGHLFLATEGGAGDTFVGSLDGGDHWRLLLRSGGSFFGWADLGFLSANVGFVVGPTRYAPEHLYRTDNGGHSWRIVRVR